MSSTVEILNPASASLRDLLSGFTEALTNRRSDLLLRYGTNLLTRFPNKLGDELWVVIEQVLLLAIEYRQRQWVVYCVERLNADFPNSTAVRRLSAMTLEGTGKYDDALKEYEAILATTPEDVATRRRFIAIAKAQGHISEAIDLLVKHLDDYQCDMEAWHELGKLYMGELNLRKARFCFEELLLHDARKLYNILSFAELSASVGEDEIAVKYYCLALTLEKDCTRALWGILMLHDASLGAKGNKSKSPVLRQLADVSKKRLTTIYSNPDNKSNQSAEAGLRLLDNLKTIY